MPYMDLVGIAGLVVATVVGVFVYSATPPEARASGWNILLWMALIGAFLGISWFFSNNLIEFTRSDEPIQRHEIGQAILAGLGAFFGFAMAVGIACTLAVIKLYSVWHDEE